VQPATMGHSNKQASSAGTALTQALTQSPHLPGAKEQPALLRQWQHARHLHPPEHCCDCHCCCCLNVIVEGGHTSSLRQLQTAGNTAHSSALVGLQHCWEALQLQYALQLYPPTIYTTADGMPGARSAYAVCCSTAGHVQG
jgi:streptolysin S family bacteriocin protoxin